MSLTEGKSNALQLTSYDMQMLLACQTHIGTKNLETAMEPYVWKRRPSDGKGKKN